MPVLKSEASASTLFHSCVVIRTFLKFARVSNRTPTPPPTMPPTDAAPPACIVVTGVQGCGKTTMANAILASFLPDTARGTPSESTASDGKDTVDVTYLLEGAALGAPSMPST